jgi:P-type Cu2+ transporter
MYMENDQPSEKYTCPMHAKVWEDKPGMCPECGMALVKSKSKSVGHKTNVFARKFWVSLVLTVPIVVYSPLWQRFLSWTPPSFQGEEWLPVILGSIVFGYGGWVFLTSAWREIKGRQPGMMTLISLAIVTAYAYSIFQVARGETETLFWELATLIVVMLLGHWIEMRAVSGAQGALRELSKLLPDVVEIERNDQIKEISLEDLKEGDVILVRPGGKIAADGKIIEGETEVDESMVSGESRPVKKGENSLVIAGTVNGDGFVRVQVEKIGEATFLAGVKRLIQEAQGSKSKLQLLSDRAAFYLTIVAVVAGLSALAVWWPLRGVGLGMERMVAVLVIACPHALGLAIPLVASVSTTMGAKNGLLVKQRLALEAARRLDVVLFDKTGTLTEGKYGVTKVMSIIASNEEEVVRLAASVDQKSEHAVARAMVEYAKEKGVEIRRVENFKRLPGRGVRGIVDGKVVEVGGKAVWKNELSEEIRKKIESEERVGETIIYVAREEELVGLIWLGDRIRQESLEAIQKLKKQNVRVAMITGDSEDVAQWVASELGIDKYFAEVLPENKVKKIKELQSQGQRVAMVGDGINDAPALAQADVGIAIGAGTNVAVESAGIVLVKNDPRDIPKIIRLSRLTYAKMIQNLWWASGYNIIALPLAAGVAITWGIVLNPAVSAVFMSLSTVIVAINAVLLRRSSLGDAGLT